MKAFKCKLKISKRVETKLHFTLSLCRELYNAALQERRDAWKLNRISISYQNQQNQLPEIKVVRKDLKDVYSQILQDVLKRLEKTFKSFFFENQERRKSRISKI